MSSTNTMSPIALNALCAALLATAARVEYERMAIETSRQASTRLSAIFGAPVTVEQGFSFEINSEL